MQITLRANEVTTEHTHFTVFINGANCGSLCMKPAEAHAFYMIVEKGCLPTDTFTGKGHWVPVSVPVSVPVPVPVSVPVKPRVGMRIRVRTDLNCIHIDHRGKEGVITDITHYGYCGVDLANGNKLVLKPTVFDIITED